MTKSDFIKELSAASGLTKEESAKAVEGMMAVMAKAFTGGESITLRGLGTFEVKTSTNRHGRDLQNGGIIKLPDMRKVKFIPGKELKEAMKLC